MPARARARVAAAIAVALALAGACSSTTTGSASSTTGTASGSGSGSSTTGRSSGTTGGTGGGTAGTTGSTSGPAGSSTRAIVFNGQGNNLDAYDTEPPFATQRVIHTAADRPDGLDINAQICFFPDGSNRFIAGEDTNQGPTDLQGWGIFQLEGDKVGELKATQLAKLVPTYQDEKDNAENYGCGFLKDGRIVTTDVGDQALGPATGQLIVWFPPFDSEKVKYCKVDVAIATAQSIWVDPNDDVWLASARPSAGADDTTSGVWKYSGPFPTSNDASGGCGKTDIKGSPLADTITKTKVISPGEHGVLSPAGIAPSGHGTLYMSSIATGVINEYELDGTYVRTILKPADGETLGTKPYSVGTPLGIGVGPDGTVYYADIGVVSDPVNGIGPGDKTGTVRRITFTNGEPNPPDTMSHEPLAFPDGIGVWVPPA